MAEEYVAEIPDEPTEKDKYIPEVFSTVGKRGIPRIDGYAKASGSAVFTRDIILPGMLYAKFLHCPFAHAKIKSMDTSKAEALPGVREVLRYDDPEVKGVRVYGGYYVGPLVVELLGDEACYEGQTLGVVVAADTEDICDEALRLIDIEWEELPFVVDFNRALEPDAPIAWPLINPDSNEVPGFGFGERLTFKQGDVEAGFKEADKIIEFTFSKLEGTAAGPEPSVGVVRWNGDYLEVWAHFQSVLQEKYRLAKHFSIPINKVVIHSPYNGAMYGGWNWMLSEWQAIDAAAAVLAKRTNRPVKVLYSRKDEFGSGNLDYMDIDFKVGAKNDGTITAIKTVDRRAMVAGAALVVVDHFHLNTKIPNLSSDGVNVLCNIGPTAEIRCEDLVPCHAMTVVFNHVADALGLDPVEVALKNDGCEGIAMADLVDFKREHGFDADRDSLKECIEKGKKAIDWDNKWHLPGTKKLPNGKMHGMAFTWTQEWKTGGTAGVTLFIEKDGSVDVLARIADIGCNTITTCAQIVAEELGVRYEDVAFPHRGLEQTGFELSTPGGSTALSSSGFAMKKAARELKWKLLKFATTAHYTMGMELPASFPGIRPEELDVKDSAIFEKANPANKVTVKEVVKLTHPGGLFAAFGSAPPVYASGYYNHGYEPYTPGRHMMCRQAHFMEVEVDPETGEVEIKKVVNVNDVGKAISPEACEGQQYGGTYMGTGWGRSEEMVYDPMTGVLLNPNLLDYKIATMPDVGSVDPILVETGLGYGAYGSTGVGEDIATTTPALLVPAVHNAIGEWIYGIPTTPDKVLKALGKV